MRKLLLLLFGLFLSLNMMAQLEVKEGSFKEVAGFVNINTEMMYDDNDKPYAVLKLKTENINDKERHQLLFQGDARTFFELEYKVGEVWVYISYYATYLKISHPDFGSTEFWFPFDMQGKKGYELTLANKTVPISSGWASLTIVTKPDNGARISLNGRDLGETTPYANNMIPAGNYKITVSKEKFVTTTKTIDLLEGDNKTVEIEMPYLYGMLSIESIPSGATIIIDGKNYGITPTDLNNIIVGMHELKLEKTGCAPVSKSFTLYENNKLTINEKLSTGREIKISTDGTGDKIFVDNIYIGNSPLTATISFGEHEITAIRGFNDNFDEIRTNLQAIKTINGVKFTNKLITVSPDGDEDSLQLNFILTFTVNDVVFEMVEIKGGTFTMGCNYEQNSDCKDDEKPSHIVSLSDYYIGKYEVTQKLWKAVMGDNPSYFKGDNLPVEQVCWYECQEFIMRLNQLTGKNFRLPTEAQWEYAARGGTKTSLYNNENIIIQGQCNSPNLDKLAWYGGNCGQNYTQNVGCDVSNGYDISEFEGKQYHDNKGGTHPVGLKMPNTYGLYDILGNVCEMCQDWAGDYSNSKQTNPKGSISGSSRIIRGGSWASDATFCRTSCRDLCEQDYIDADVGFRLVLVPDNTTSNNNTSTKTESNNSGVFSVSPTKKVCFSTGNLQYQASTKTWRFADKQWDIIGNSNNSISSTYSGWIDLFGWGTGNNPIKNSTNDKDYSGFKDWGNNKISNGNGERWRTLSKEEWIYLLNRNTYSGIRFVKATVNGINGLILLPDNWDISFYSFRNFNRKDTSFNTNIISQEEWIEKCEAHGAVFLPCSGRRDGNSVFYVNSDGGYWTSTKRSNDDKRTSHGIWFSDNDFYVQNGGRSYGVSVRLVHDVKN